MASTTFQKKKLRMKEDCSMKSGQMTPFVEANRKALCFICREFVQVFKVYNLKRHYMQKHAAKFNVYEGLFCKDKIEEVKKVCLLNKNVSKCYNSGRYYHCKGQLCGSIFNSKKSKPLTDGECIKQCIESMADIICPEKKGDISKISLSHQTIDRQTEETGNLSKEV